MQLFEQADELLMHIKEESEQKAALEQEAEGEIQLIAERYQEKLGPIKERLELLKKEIVSLMKKHRAVFFDGRDKVSLAHGSLKYSQEEKVTLPRDALEKIEEQGWIEAIKIKKSVDQAVVKGWPDERLFLIGAMRKPKELFGYDIKEDHDSRS